MQRHQAALAKLRLADHQPVRGHILETQVECLGYAQSGRRQQADQGAVHLLFELVNRRYEQSSTLVTTNRPFAEWHEVFPNAACVVSLVDRLVHNAEVVAIEGKSYRLKEAQERAEQKARQRRPPKPKKETP